MTVRQTVYRSTHTLAMEPGEQREALRRGSWGKEPTALNQRTTQGF